MAHLGTAVQIAARGAQDGSLTGSDPGDSWFVRHVRDSPTFGEEAVEIPPLRAAAFGKTAVFPLPRDRDMLGDMFLELRLPALQPTLGTSLPPHEPPEIAFPSAMSGPCELPRVSTFDCQRISPVFASMPTTLLSDAA